VLDHQGQGDALGLRPGFLDERVDVGLRGQGREERNAPAFEKGGEVRGHLADDKGSLGVESRIHPAQAGAHLPTQLFLGRFTLLIAAHIKKSRFIIR
jgi:hypothetical protein